MIDTDPRNDHHHHDHHPTSGDVATTALPADVRYLAPDGLTRRILNPLVRTLVRVGVGVRGGRILHVRGRTSGEWRTTPVNPLTLGGERYLVAPRGCTQWVRNLRAAGSGRLQLGRRFEEFTAVEVADVEKGPVIRAYLELWAMETGKFFDGLDASSSDDEIAAVAPGFPVFRIEARA